MLERAMLLDLRSRQSRPTVAEEPLVSSARAGWNGFLLERHRIESVEKEHVCALQHMVFLQLENSISVEWQGDGQDRTVHINPGQVSILPAYLPYSARCANVGEFLMVSLEHKFLACAAAEIGASSRIELRLMQGMEDPLIREILLSLCAEAENNHPEGTIYAESMATALAVHILRKHAAVNPRVNGDQKGLAKTTLRRTIDYIHDNLSGDISLMQLAGVAGLSPFHFARQFKRSTGLAPHEYVTHCRVERAKDLLRLPRTNIADVAFEVGFYDQSHLTRHFKRHCNITPAAFARHANQSKKVQPEALNSKTANGE